MFFAKRRGTLVISTQPCFFSVFLFFLLRSGWLQVSTYLMRRSYVFFVAFRWVKLSVVQLLSYQCSFVCSEFRARDTIAMQADDCS